MNTLKLIIQFGCLVFLASIALILVHNGRQTGKSSSLPSAIPSAALSQHWTYAQFEFTGPRTVEYGKKMNASLVYYDYKKDDNMATEPARTNRLIGADQLLGELSDDGWQFVWTDGTNFLTRRADGGWKHAFFVVEYLPATP